MNVREREGEVISEAMDMCESGGRHGTDEERGRGEVGGD